MKKDVGTQDVTMKLHVKRTLAVGFAFMGIMCFWEVYDYIMPLILQRYFGMSSAGYGFIMGLDNLLAIFLLPLFGSLSDRAVKAKYGRRTSFIFIGSVCAAVLLVVLSLVENIQYVKIVEAGIADPAKLVEGGYLAPEFLNDSFGALATRVGAGEKLLGGELATYNSYLSALYDAQCSMSGAMTKASPGAIVGFIVVLLLLLVAMSSYRSPAVALMPDVTPKPLRSQANALITFMGGAGGLVSIVLYKILANKRYQSHIALFCTLGGMLLLMLLAYLLTVREKKFVADRLYEEKEWGVVDEEEQSVGTRLSKPKTVSLLLILLTVFLWFMGYNAVKSHLSTYATSVLMMEDSFVGTINIINGIGGAIALLPVAFMAAKLGRKKSIIIGLLLAGAAFIPCFFMTANTPNLKIWFPLCFILSGFGLVCVNVNTLPMVTELSKGSNVGKYTGYYYGFSMSAQAVTPLLAGLFMDNVAKNSVFIYGAVLIFAAVVTIALVKHGDNKPLKKKKALEYFSDED